jgi:hypothetical protein
MMPMTPGIIQFALFISGLYQTRGRTGQIVGIDPHRPLHYAHRLSLSHRLRGGENGVGDAGVRAVDDKSDLHLLSRGQQIAVAHRNDQAGTDLPIIYQPLQFLFRLDVGRDVEIAGCPVRLDQLAAGRGSVSVQDGDAQMFDIGGGGVAHEHQFDNGHEEHHHQRTPVAQDVQEFLADQRKGAQEVHIILPPPGSGHRT